jgi:pimeloyl-ACP methyl ester carboxylesterase
LEPCKQKELAMQSSSARAETHAGTVQSIDGTPIAFQRFGGGPPLILVVGAFNEKSTGAPLAQYLAPHHTVYTYDRRGRGESGDTAPYAIEREIEDLHAIIDEAGGSAAVFGFSSGALLAAKAAARGLTISKLALYEPPFQMVDPRANHPGKLADLVLAEKRGEAVEYFQTELVGIPADVVALLRTAPFRPGLEAMAHTLVYEALICVDTQLQTELGSIRTQTLALAGELSPEPLQAAARALANQVPGAQYQAISGVGHDLVPEKLGPVLEAYLR